jgi:DNA (cytosine-5)-methyltransferase 1
LFAYTVGSLFAGIGGIDSAFEQAGFEVLWANEIDKNACKTFIFNYPHIKLIEKDVRQLSPQELEKVDVITSGFPCQAFSVAGYREGFNDRKGRGNLFFETARLIEELRPKAYFLENVKNLASHDKGKTLEVIRKTLVEDLGYSFIPFILNAKDYGNIPQNRERIYIVGFRDESEFVFDINQNPVDSILKYVGKDKYSIYFEIPEPIELTKTIHDILEKTKVDDKYYYKEDHKYYGKLKESVVSRDTVYQWRRVYVRENKNKVCPTLTANMGAGGHNVPIIIDGFGIRKLTPMECARFQGFGSNFRFPPNMADSHCYHQIGNSVVVPVVKRIAENILKALEKVDYESHFLEAHGDKRIIRT